MRQSLLRDVISAVSTNNLHYNEPSSEGFFLPVNNILNIVRSYLISHQRGWAFAIVLMACLVYFPFLNSSFIFDDLPFFSGNAASEFSGSIFSFNLRWLPYASMGWTWAFFLENPFYYRIINLLIHGINGVLLFYLFLQIKQIALKSHKTSTENLNSAWLAAVLFVCNPVAVYAVGYMIQRSILLALMFSLVLQLAYIKGLTSGKARWLVVAAIAYFLAVFSKEHSVMVLAVLVALTWLIWSDKKISKLGLVIIWVCFISIALLIIFRARGVFGVPYEPTAAALFKHQGVKEVSSDLLLLSILTQAKLYFKYLILWIFPVPPYMSIDMREQYVTGMGAWGGWSGIFGYIAYGIFAIQLLIRKELKGLIGFALLYPWLQFILEFSTIRVQEVFVLYRSYLWMPGIFLIAMLIIDKYYSVRLKLIVLMMIFLIIGFSWNRLWVMADEFRLWNDAAKLINKENESSADRIYYNRGLVHVSRQEWQKASEDMERVIKISPDVPQAHYWNAMALANMGKNVEAIKEFNNMIKKNSEDAQAYFGMGMVYKKIHKQDESIMAMKKACSFGNRIACIITDIHK